MYEIRYIKDLYGQDSVPLAVPKYIGNVLSEKPELTFQVNTGVYILNSSSIEEIPEGEFFHITHLMEKIKAHGGCVGCFPVSELAWKDMGEWPEYLKMIDVI